MKLNKKLCDGCGEHRFIWKNSGGKRYCKQCWSAHSVKIDQPIPIAKQRKPIPPRSPKRIKEERIYSGKRIIFLSENSMCKANLSGCTNQATDVHHKAGRIGTLYLDERFWLPVCRTCHMWIETHPIEAREMGLSTSKINPEL